MSHKKYDFRKPIKWFFFRLIIVVILNVLFGIFMFTDNPIMRKEDIQYYTGTVVKEYSTRSKLPQSSQLDWYMVVEDGTIFRTHYSMIEVHPKNFVGKTVTIGYCEKRDWSNAIPITTFSEGSIEYLSLSKSQRNVIFVNLIVTFVFSMFGSVYILYCYGRIKKDIRMLKEHREIERKRRLRRERKNAKNNILPP